MNSQSCLAAFIISLHERFVNYPHFESIPLKLFFSFSIKYSTIALKEYTLDGEFHDSYYAV